MHLALITTSYPDSIPGSEAAGSFVEDFAKELSQHIQVTVIAPSLKSSIESDENLEIRRFAVPRLPLSLLKPTNPNNWLAISQTLARGKSTLEQLVQEQRVDHILALWALPSGYWAQNISKKHNIPYSIWALGSDIWSLGKIPVIRSILKKVILNSQNCFADGIKLSEDVESISGKSCIFLPSSRRLPGIERKDYSTIPPYRLTFIGRWHPNKGIDILLDSLSHLHEDDWKLIKEVVICGGGPMENLVIDECYKLTSQKHPITHRGFINKTEASEILSNSDYLIIPSRIESIPVVFSDALQTGCPVIATPVGDLPRLLTEYKPGVLAKNTSSSSLTEAIRTAIHTKPLSFRDAIKQLKLTFDIGNTVSRVLNIIKV